MRLLDSQLKVLLLGANLLDPEQFELAEKKAKEKNIPLMEYLPETGLISEEHLGQVVASYLKFEYVNLKKGKVDEEVLHLVPELVARSKGVIAFERTEQGVKVGMLNPDDLETIHFVEKRAGQKVLPYLVTKRALKEALSLYRASLHVEFEKILSVLRDKSLTREERDGTTVKMVDTLLSYGYQSKASDIHIEPHRGKVVVRFRIDGVMHGVLEAPKDLLDLIVTRIKILSKMRTDEHRAAQDGKIRFDSGEEVMDIRVSVVPVTEGENVVMRILSAKSRQFGLSSLGIQDADLAKVKSAMANPHGMILVTGPTGSGKTTTLYGILKILNTSDVHISTIEDPVEYDIEGVSQIQVNTKTDLTFAKGLRAIVRQDPDIIMVGEIRDSETAGIAVNSAMTGHLVLSTLHANDAATTLPRLLDMGIEPFLVASTVNVAIAQRLVRKICEKCRASAELSEDEKRMVENDPHIKSILMAKEDKDLGKVMVFKGGGCKVCGNTGYSGRVGIFEILEMKENIKDLIVKQASSSDIMKVARENGMTTMMEDGIMKVLSGVTTLEEILRVTRE